MISRIKIAALLVGASLALTACGVRGPLEKPSSSGAGPQPEATANADSGQGKAAGEAPKPHKPFILDKILE